MDQFKDFDKFTEEIKEAQRKIMPQMDSVLAKLKESTFNLEPKGIKDCKVKGMKAKVTIYKDNAIKIEFADKDFGINFYESLK